MSLKGNLEDVSVVDVIQFIYIGGRTGTLGFRTQDGEARLGFQRGRITNAWRTGAPRLGELLVAAGALDDASLKRALATQEEERPRRSIGQVLISLGLVVQEKVHEVLARHFTALVQDIVAQQRGTFEFVLDDVWPVEDLAAFPGDVAAKVELDTQMILLEALNALDEMRRGERPASARDSANEEFVSERTLTDDEVVAALAAEPASPLATTSSPGTPTPTPTSVVRSSFSSTSLPAMAAFPRIQVVTTDTGLAERVRNALATENARVSAVPARDAGSTLPGESAPIVVIDIRGSSLSVESIRALRRTRPRASVVAYCQPHVPLNQVYDAGAAAAVHGDETALAACVRGLYRARTELSTESLVADGIREGFARLRRIVGELRSGLLSTTVSLNLMNAVAESLDRAILFVIQQDLLIPLGAFGVVSSGKKLFELSRNLQITLREPSVFTECVETGRARLARYEEANLPKSFKEIVNRPRAGQIAVLPVSGSQRVIAIIYVDNGNKDRPIADIQVLELAAFQLGLALENEFLRRARDTARANARSPQLRNAS
jgi:hypothetical protein